MSYIASTDITDLVVKAFITASDTRVTTWLTRTDEELVYQAGRCGVTSDDFAASAANLHPKVKEYARAYYGAICCEDNVRHANIENQEADKYAAHAKFLRELLDKLAQGLTQSMFVYDGSTDSDLIEDSLVGGGVMYRG